MDIAKPMKELLLLLIVMSSVQTQAQVDSIPTASDTLKSIDIIGSGRNYSMGLTKMYGVDGVTITQGKKSEVIQVQNLLANKATNNSRQLFSRIGGINIFENDGSGLNIGIGGRGLNPNRMSNFNTRQNGYDISADALGYPESYYTPPAEAIERIDILRGAASLQFGTQFGGMINYKITAPSLEKWHVSSRTTAGSFGLMNYYNQVSGTLKKTSYLLFHQQKKLTGWRPNSSLEAKNIFFQLTQQLGTRSNLRVEFTHSGYLQQQPGGLTLLQFETQPKQSNRRRNWFQVDWNMLHARWQTNWGNAWNFEIHATHLHARRDALGSLERIDRFDDPAVFRNLLRDNYNNQLIEARLLHRYQWRGLVQTWLMGLRFYKGQTKRLQGLATSSDRPEFHFNQPDQLENGAYLFPSANGSAFLEHIFQLTPKFSVVPGVRLEGIQTEADGYYRITNRDLAGNILLDTLVYEKRQNDRHFLIAGIGTLYKWSKVWETYVNFSQNYRSINFNDMRVVNPNFAVDPQLRDETGYTLDGGLRGQLRNKIYLDLSAFYLHYQDRIGAIMQYDESNLRIVRYRTNIGQSVNAGVEAFIEVDWNKLFFDSCRHQLTSYVNYSFVHARYTKTSLLAFENNVVEYVPSHILRLGMTYQWRNFRMSVDYSFTSEQFGDASNATETPYATFGIIPSYQVLDISAAYQWRYFTFGAGVNNALNASYFTRRAEGYPGPGIIPAEPLSAYLSIGFTLSSADFKKK
jgi:Fe(3+) dicitrate transport protein